MDKHSDIEGSPATKMIQFMRKYGKNKDASIEVAVVKNAMPDLVLLLESDNIELDIDDLFITQTASDSGLAVGDNVLVIGDDDTQKYFVIDKVV